MKRLLLVASLLAVASVLMGSGVLDLMPAPNVTLWTSRQPNVSTAAATEAESFFPSLTPRGPSGRFGTVAFQFDGISCGWDVAGSGGSTGVVAAVVQTSDAGVICSCTLGACNTTAGVTLPCDCGGVKYLNAGNWDAGNYAVQLTTATDCAGNPKNVVCSVLLHR